MFKCHSWYPEIMGDMNTNYTCNSKVSWKFNWYIIREPSIYLSIYPSFYLSTIVNKLIPCIHAWADFEETSTQWSLGGEPSGVLPNFGSKVTCGPWGPILCKYAKCYSSYRLHSTMLKLCHSSTVVGVPSGCSGFLGPGSNMGHRAHFNKSCIMLLLLQFIWYDVETLSQ